MSTTFNTQLGRFRYTVMPFGVTLTGDVFQCKLDQCFGKIKQVIVIADDIMIVGKKPNHNDHDQALTTLLETARRINVKLNYFSVRPIPQVVTSLIKVKCQQLPRCLCQ